MGDKQIQSQLPRELVEARQEQLQRHRRAHRAVVPGARPVRRREARAVEGMGRRLRRRRPAEGEAAAGLRFSGASADGGGTLISPENRIDFPPPGLAGAHQIDNAGLALMALQATRPYTADGIANARANAHGDIVGKSARERGSARLGPQQAARPAPLARAPHGQRRDRRVGVAGVEEDDGEVCRGRRRVERVRGDGGNDPAKSSH